jgi:hypothetical protein
MHPVLGGASQQELVGFWGTLAALGLSHAQAACPNSVLHVFSNCCFVNRMLLAQVQAENTICCCGWVCRRAHAASNTSSMQRDIGLPHARPIHF